MSRKRVDELCRDWMVSRYPPNCFTPVERDVLAITKTASLWYESTFHGRHLSLFIGKKFPMMFPMRVLVPFACCRLDDARVKQEPRSVQEVYGRISFVSFPSCFGGTKRLWMREGRSLELLLFYFYFPIVSRWVLQPWLRIFFIISTRSRAALDIIPV